MDSFAQKLGCGRKVKESQWGARAWGPDMSPHCVEGRQHLSRALKVRWTVGTGRWLEKALITK